MDIKPLRTNAKNGQYSTAIIGDYIETVFFPNDPDIKPTVIGRLSINKAQVARDHIRNWENR